MTLFLALMISHGTLCTFCSIINNMHYIIWNFRQFREKIDETFPKLIRNLVIRINFSSFLCDMLKNLRAESVFWGKNVSLLWLSKQLKKLKKILTRISLLERSEINISKSCRIEWQIKGTTLALKKWTN